MKTLEHLKNLYRITSQSSLECNCVAVITLLIKR